MTTLKVRFDGQVLVPETPIDLPRDRVFEISVLETEITNGAASDAPPLAGLGELLAGLPEAPDTPTDLSMRSGMSALADWAESLPAEPDVAPESPDSPLAGLQELLADLPEDPNTPTDLAMRGGRSALADWAEQLPADPDAPTDGAAQHDHYLYGMPKRP